MKIINCPHCGRCIKVNGLGRKRLNKPVNIVLDTLRSHSNIAIAARELGVSRGYIYLTLKKAGLTIKEVIGQ